MKTHPILTGQFVRALAFCIVFVAFPTSAFGQFGPQFGIPSYEEELVELLPANAVVYTLTVEDKIEVSATIKITSSEDTTDLFAAVFVGLKKWDADEGEWEHVDVISNVHNGNAGTSSSGKAFANTIVPPDESRDITASGKSLVVTPGTYIVYCVAVVEEIVGEEEEVFTSPNYGDYHTNEFTAVD